MRGEHRSEEATMPAVEGSSPHARGAQGGPGGLVGAGGLIPACAGSTSLQRMSRRGPRAHPRMRGEHTLTEDASDEDIGSSPHARGARFLTWGNVRKSAGSDSVYRRASSARSSPGGASAAGGCGCLAPTGTPGILLGGSAARQGPSDQRQALHIHGFPVVSVSLEAHALLAIRCIYQQCSPVSAQLLRSVPELLTDPGGDIADECPRANLQEPLGEVAAKTCWAGGEHEDHHDAESSSSKA